MHAYIGVSQTAPRIIQPKNGNGDTLYIPQNCDKAGNIFTSPASEYMKRKTINAQQCPQHYTHMKKQDPSVPRQAADTFTTTLVSHSLYVPKAMTVLVNWAGPGHGSGHWITFTPYHQLWNSYKPLALLGFGPDQPDTGSWVSTGQTTLNTQTGL